MPRAAVRGSDRRVAVDVGAPDAVDEGPPLRDARSRFSTVVEAGVEHPGPNEDLVEHVLPIRLAGHPLDGEPGERVADVAVPALDAGRGERLLVGELGQEVGRLDDRVVGLLEEQVLVLLARLLVSVIGDATRVREQMQQSDVRG